MGRIRFDTTPVEAYIRWLEGDASSGDVVHTRAFAFALERHEHLSREVIRDDRHFTPELAIEVLDAARAGRPFACRENRFFERLYSLVRENMDVPRQREKLDAIKRIPCDDLSALVSRRLSGGLVSDRMVHFVPEAHSNAWVHQGVASVSFFPLGVRQGEVYLMDMSLQSVLMHEVHHLGLAEIQEKEWRRELLRPGERVVVDALAALAGEGSATHFFSPPGPARLPGWRITESALPTHVSWLRDSIHSWITGTISEEDAETDAFNHLHGQPADGGDPPVYVMGTAMCRRVETTFGEDVLIENLARPCTLAALFADSQRAMGEEPWFDAGTVQTLRDIERRLLR